jgi:hypothetical protein
MRGVSAPAAARRLLQPLTATSVDGDRAAAPERHRFLPQRPGMSSSSRWPTSIRQCRVDDEVVADRLEPEHRPEQEQRRPGRPGLRAAGVGYWTGYFVSAAS